jgi:hypothetical protein
MAPLDDFPASAAVPATDALPPHTTPTWEVELLISGVAAFAMVQLPGWLDDAVFALRPRFDATWSGSLMILYIYAKMAAVILASTFVLHLLLRARWIALVGVLSVHPQGIRWERMRIGPVAREIEKARLGHIPDAIERADNLATTVFAVGVSLAVVLLWVMVLAVGATAASVLFGSVGVPNPMLVALCILIVPYGLIQLIDRRVGARLPADSAAGRLLRGILRLYAHLGFGLQRNLGMAVLTSNLGRFRLTGLTLAVMLLALGSVMEGYDAMRHPDQVGSFALFPSDAPEAIDSAHYDDMRNPARDAPVPYLPSMLAKEPYLRVVVPYAPVRDEPAMRRACPTLEHLTGVVRATQALACLGRLHALSLDGMPVATAYEVGNDPRTDRPALVAMLDIRALPAGRHVLTVAQPLDPEVRTPEPAVARIPFWR